MEIFSLWQFCWYCFCKTYVDVPVCPQRPQQTMEDIMCFWVSMHINWPQYCSTVKSSRLTQFEGYFAYIVLLLFCLDTTSFLEANLPSCFRPQSRYMHFWSENKEFNGIKGIIKKIGNFMQFFRLSLRTDHNVML